MGLAACEGIYYCWAEPSTSTARLLIRGKKTTPNRVRCDLKDLPFSSTGTQPQCSNCKERGLKCVFVLHFPNLPLSLIHSYILSDEFAEVKAVKLLRRGRRLQQVESV